MKDNVTPIFATVPLLEARPEHGQATPEEIAAFHPTQDWILLRVDDVFAAAGLVKPENATAANHQRGTVLRWGPDADLLQSEGLRIQWRQQAHYEPIKLGEAGELLMLVRARDVVAILA